MSELTDLAQGIWGEVRCDYLDAYATKLSRTLADNANSLDSDRWITRIREALEAAVTPLEQELAQKNKQLVRARKASREKHEQSKHLRRLLARWLANTQYDGEELPFDEFELQELTKHASRGLTTSLVQAPLSMEDLECR